MECVYVSGGHNCKKKTKQNNETNLDNPRFIQYGSHICISD